MCVPRSSKRQSLAPHMMGSHSFRRVSLFLWRLILLRASLGFYRPPVLLYMSPGTCRYVALVPKSEASLWQAKGKKTCLSALGGCAQLDCQTTPTLLLFYLLLRCHWEAKSEFLRTFTVKTNMFIWVLISEEMKKTTCNQISVILILILH